MSSDPFKLFTRFNIENIVFLKFVCFPYKKSSTYIDYFLLIHICVMNCLCYGCSHLSVYVQNKNI